MYFYNYTLCNSNSKLYILESKFIGAEINNLLLYMVVICINMHTALNLPMQPAAPMRIPYPWPYPWGLFIIFIFFTKNLDYSKKEFSSLLCVHTTVLLDWYTSSKYKIYISVYIYSSIQIF